MTTAKNEKPDVWLGLRRCGCAVAIVVDDPAHRKDTEKSKRDFLKEGLSVVSATWDEWLTVYRPKFMADCEHRTATKAEVPNGTSGAVAVPESALPFEGA